MPRHLTRMIYIDDSGFNKSGIAVFGWVEFDPDHWADVLATWLAMRKRLWREWRVAVSEELHATDFVNGRGHISQRIPDKHIHDGIEYWKDFGRDVAVECLDTMRCLEGLRVGAVYRRVTQGDFHEMKRDAYAALIARFELELEDSDTLALVFMDGDASDTSYRSAHRRLELRSRRVIEDAIHLDSRHSQLIQMADLVAWTAYASVERFTGHEFAWDWYPIYLAQRDPARAPRQV